MKGSGRIDRPSLMNSPGSGGLALRALVPMLLAVLITGAGVGAAAAQTVPPPGVRVSFTADRSELTVGDLVTLSLVVAHPADLVVVVPRVGREWGPFEVQAQTSVQTVSDNDVVRTVAKQFRVTAFAPGALETPALPVYIRAPDGSVRQVHANPVRVTVNSVLAGPDEQLKDLRSPAGLSTPFWEQPVVLALAALVVLVAAAGAGYYLYRRSHRLDTAAQTVVDTRSPWEVAMQELDRIDRIDLPGSGDLRGHYTLVSGVVRVYLGATHLRDAGRMEATEMSTEEIGAAISQSSLGYEHARLVIDLLREADLVKFANYGLLWPGRVRHRARCGISWRRRGPLPSKRRPAGLRCGRQGRRERVELRVAMAAFPAAGSACSGGVALLVEDADGTGGHEVR